mmetsp:Transcript_28475/g.68487  ORF Transcript_28475/g.68487 Transcript_28475/m.68487 type:complete len:348 (-) Transcript_28475:141-1184(-)
MWSGRGALARSSTAMIASSSALWASMGPGMTSPTAMMFGCWDVRKPLWESTSIWPNLLIGMPSFSNPSPSVNGRRPTHINTTSHSKACVDPSFKDSMWTVAPLPWTSPFVTFVEVRMLSPCFCMTLWKALPTSESSPGQMRSMNSTTVTSAPRAPHTDPSSIPITPPPITTIFLGTSLSDNAPVEVTTIFSSTGSPMEAGKVLASDPVQMRECSASISVTLPWSSVAVNVVAVTNSPLPLTYATLFFFKRPSIPFVSPTTALSLAFIILGRSIVTLSALIPNLAMCPFFSSWYLCVAFSKALDGMHPTLRQVPPRAPRFSMHTVFKPSCEALIAATYPAGPPPITAS